MGKDQKSKLEGQAQKICDMLISGAMVVGELTTGTATEGRSQFIQIQKLML